MIIYVPRLIETVEQAEALPRGTVATYGKGSMTLTAHRVTSLAMKPDAWNVMDDLLSSSDMVGWTALMPVEAEEETRDHPGVMLPTNPPRYPQQTRLVTPWEVLADRP